jgi:hypothetical protein
MSGSIENAVQVQCLKAIDPDKPTTGKLRDIKNVKASANYLSVQNIYFRCLGLEWKDEQAWLVVEEERIGLFERFWRSILSYLFSNTFESTVAKCNRLSTETLGLAYCIPYQSANELQKEVKVSAEVRAAFASVHSSTPMRFPHATRDAAREHRIKPEPLVVSTSDFVPPAFRTHFLDRNLTESLNVKSPSGGPKTLMEGSMQLFQTFLSPGYMAGDYAYKKEERHIVVPFDAGQVRRCVFVGNIQPDFQSHEEPVTMQIAELIEESVEGDSLPKGILPLLDKVKNNEEDFERARKEHDELLRKHQIYHLTKAHKLPSSNHVVKWELEEGMASLEMMIERESSNYTIAECLSRSAISLSGHILSMEVLFNLYVHQIINTFSPLEALLLQGYVCMIDPASIFAGQIGSEVGAQVLDRLQILAFKYLKNQGFLFTHLKGIGFNNYGRESIKQAAGRQVHEMTARSREKHSVGLSGDLLEEEEMKGTTEQQPMKIVLSKKDPVDLLKAVFPDVQVRAKRDWFQGQGGHYSPEQLLKIKDEQEPALVLQLNSDPFGDNWEAEKGNNSLEAALGQNSTLAINRRRGPRTYL